MACLCQQYYTIGVHSRTGHVCGLCIHIYTTGGVYTCVCALCTYYYTSIYSVCTSHCTTQIVFMHTICTPCVCVHLTVQQEYKVNKCVCMCKCCCTIGIPSTNVAICIYTNIYTVLIVQYVYSSACVSVYIWMQVCMCMNICRCVHTDQFQ